MESNKDIFSFEEKDVVNNNLHDFRKDDTVIGIVKSITEGTFGQQITLEFEGKDIIVGYYTALDGKITKDDIGKSVKIVYNGDKKGEKSKRIYMDFKVYKKDIK